MTERRGRVGVHDTDARGFAKRLDSVLKDAHVTLDEFATRMQYARRQVAKWTTSQNPTIPDAAILLKICREFALSPTHLLLGKGPAALNATIDRLALGDEVRAALRDQLRERGFDPIQVDRILAADGDVLDRLADTYAMRLRLSFVAALFGLNDEDLSFGVKEIELRYRGALHRAEES